MPKVEAMASDPLLSRRMFVDKSARTLLAAGLTRAGVLPLTDPLLGYQKTGLRLLTATPLNAEASVHSLDPEVTPTSSLFVRNNGLIPDFAVRQDASAWQLTIDGEVERALVLSLAELQARFKHYSYQLVLECGGNGRIAYQPATPGLQWSYGAVGCPSWQGVLLRDVLAAAGVKASAVYVGYYGYDAHLNGDPKQDVISRGFPIAKALDPMTMIAWGLNGQPLPAVHGFPARLVCPGYPASASGKWLRRLWVRDRVHDGAKMEGYSYRVPREPVAPGSFVPTEAMVIIEEMPVKSLITAPQSAARHQFGRPLPCRGFAWSGSGGISEVMVSYDFGQSWLPTVLQPAVNRFAWQRWTAQLHVPKRGYYELWARARDESGRMQPMVVPGWNPHGYVNNAMPRISVQVV